MVGQFESPSAGPFEELLATWRACFLYWEAFVVQYRTEQQQQIAYLIKTHGDEGTATHVVKGRSINNLHMLVQQETVTVSCRKQDACCHRFLLMQGSAVIGSVYLYHLW